VPAEPVPAGRSVRFGNYELREELGRGGMGVVFRAVQAVARREVAVKVLLGGAVGDAVHRGRFAAEVSALAQLRHANIVTVFEVGEVAGSAFFSMEYAPNGTLAGRLKQGPLPFLEAAVLVGKLAEATEAAHRLGVLHRDIKPGNVLIGADGEPKLSDFGLAKWLNQDEGLTATGAGLGTPSYMPPEQARGAKEVGPAADVYALGATLYACLTGRPPFQGPDSYAIIQRVLTVEPAAPRTIRPDAPAELEAICLKCLDKDPAKRYRAAKELADDLARWRNGESTVARPLTRRRRAWRRVKRNWKPLAAAVGLLAGVAIVVAALRRPDKPPEPDPPVAQIEAALKRGEKVTLIDSGGRPRYQRWVIGTGDMGDPEPNQPLMVQCAQSGMLELTPDSYNDRFRLTAEFQQEASLSPESSAGIYFSHKVGRVGPAGSVDRVLVLQFHDDMINNKPIFRVGDPVELLDYLVPRTEDVPMAFRGGSLGTYLVQETKKGRVRPWRKVVVEVAPDMIQAYWRNPDGSMQPLRAGGIRAEILRNNEAGNHIPFLKERYPGIEYAGLEYSPRGGVGLYLRDARVYFKGVVLEPLGANQQGDH
jgi:serine/threonine-protein kinase